MKFPQVLFLLTAIICGCYVISRLISQEGFDGSFYVALFWTLTGLYLWKTGVEK